MLKFALSDLKDIQTINKLSNDAYPYCAVYFSGKDEDELISYSVFLLKEGEAELLDLCAVRQEDRLLLIATAKSAFNTLDLSGIHRITSKNTNLSDLLIGLGFSKTEEEFHLNLEGYFTPCNCKGETLHTSCDK